MELCNAEERDNKPGRPRICPPCPVCGENMMRSYGTQTFGSMVTRFCGCQQCQYTDVWVEPKEGGHGYWRKLSQRKNLPTIP